MIIGDLQDLDIVLVLQLVVGAVPCVVHLDQLHSLELFVKLVRIRDGQ